MKKTIISCVIALYATSTLALAQTSAQPFTQTSPPSAMVAQQSSQGNFTKKRYTVHGSWEIVTLNGEKIIRFSDGFKTKNGPDLKVFLSPSKLDSLGKKTDVTNAVNIGVLKSNKGEQTYRLPEGVELSDYKSVLIHCEAYSVLWGGFDIPQ